ncbi:uncharacterized protein BDR25DRAFT_263858, partial [Lindgomyces ingoldianus]
MGDTQIHSIQCPNDFSESMENGIVCLDSPISATDRPLHTLTVPTRAEGQAKGKHPTRPAEEHTKFCSKRCAQVYKVDRLYVGLLGNLPPPSVVQDKWDRDVRPDLESYLCQATSMLSKSMRDDEVITELVLCMAGKKCSPASVVLEAGMTCPKDPIALKPTVWIHCGSKKCKKKVRETIRNLAYLNHFLDTFCMEPPYTSLHAPWPAAREISLYSPRLEGKACKMTFAVQCPRPGWKSICGAKARFTIQTSDGTIERYSTLGGSVMVGSSLFGLTSAHAIMNFFHEGSRSASINEVESTNNICSDSGSDCETSSDSEPEAFADSPCSSQTQTSFTRRPPLDANRIHGTEDVRWVEVPLPQIIAYLGHGTTSGDYAFPDLAPNASDFALIDIGSLGETSNEFHNPDNKAVAPIWGFIPTRDLPSGEVWIIATCGGEPLEGYLLEGDASVIVRGAVMRTKKIQVVTTGAPGLSGSWVVRDGALCGSIYAADDRS